MLQGAFFKASTFKTMWLGWGIWCHHSRVFLFCFGVFVLVLLRLQKSNFLLAFFFFLLLMFPLFQVPKLMNLPWGMEGEGVSGGLRWVPRLILVRLYLQSLLG